MWNICKKEWGHFFGSLTGYLAIILFLVLNGTLLFILKDNVFEYGYATLDAFFRMAPWVLVFLVPALSMRILTDEYRAGTIEILLTKPISKASIIMGKYCSLLGVLLLVLVSTGSYIVTISMLTDAPLDSGGIAGSYLGLFLLGAVYASISLWCGSLTDNSIIAFLSGAASCIVIYYGFNSISKLPVFSGSIDYYLETLGIDYHYYSISRGVVDSRDMIYFMSVIVFFLWATALNVKKK